MYCQDCTKDFTVQEKDTTPGPMTGEVATAPASVQSLKEELETELVGKPFSIPPDDTGPALRSKKGRKRKVEVCKFYPLGKELSFILQHCAFYVTSLWMAISTF